jgi:AcrR family transcriptional regulator
MSDSEAKDRILKAAIALMEETEDSEKITVRQVAERAGVGVGLINYHFQTKDSLLFAAIGEYMIGMIEAVKQAPTAAGSPAENLKAMLKTICEFGFRHEKQMRVGSQYLLQQGDFSAANFLLPILREMFAGKKDENAVRLMAFQILVTTNVVLLRSDGFFSFMGMDIRDKAHRERLIDMLIDNYLV